MYLVLCWCWGHRVSKTRHGLCPYIAPFVRLSHKQPGVQLQADTKIVNLVNAMNKYVRMGYG